MVPIRAGDTVRIRPGHRAEGRTGVVTLAYDRDRYSRRIYVRLDEDPTPGEYRFLPAELERVLPALKEYGACSLPKAA